MENKLLALTTFLAVEWDTGDAREGGDMWEDVWMM